MRDPQRIEPLLAKIRELWAMVPDWRLGQLLYNASRYLETTGYAHTTIDLFNVEDDALLEGLMILTDVVNAKREVE